MSKSILDLVPPKADSRVYYGSNPLQFMDVWSPNVGKPWPVVMNIHGGFWRAAYDLAHAGHFCAALSAEGFCTANVEYRRAGNPGGGWPGTLDDIRSAYGYLQHHAQELGCDPERLVVTGHSAGGHLAVCLASHEQSLKGVVPLAGVLDLEAAYNLHLSKDAVVEFLGGTPKQIPDRYLAASPMHQSVKARQVVITGTDDDTVPAELSRRYVATKKAVGEDVELVEIPGADHMDVIDPRSGAFGMIAQVIRKLVWD